MIGTWVNVAGILAGCGAGLLLKKGIPERINDAVVKAQGVAVFVIGLGGMLSAMLSVGADGKIRSSGELLLLVSLAGGCVLGELLRIDDRLEGVGDALGRRLKQGNISKGFVTASLLYCVGAMTIVGPLNDGLTGDHTILFTKAVLDGITGIVLTASLGPGTFFAAIPVLVIQGAITLLAGAIAPFATDEAIRLFSMVGYAVIMPVGFNFMFNAKIRVANLLPALAVPVVWYAVATALGVAP